MTFLNPVYFWAFLSLIPLAAIYFLKVRPRRKPTTAYFLWQKVFEEKRTSSLFNRLRDFWSLLLMILAFSAIALALTNPERAGDERKDLFILIDQSASMNASAGVSHLEMAKDRARDLIQALNGQQRAAVASVADDITFHSYLTDNPRQLLDAVDRIGSTVLPLDPNVISAMDQQRAKESENDSAPATDESFHRVLFLTDGAFSEGAVPESVEIMKVGETLENAGFMAADLQVLPGAEDRLGLYFQIASSFTDTRRADVVVRRAGSQVIGKLIEVAINPGVNPPEVFTLEQSEAGAWEIELELTDALTADNTAYLVAHQSPPIRVKVATEDRYFFENSVLAFSTGSGLLTLVEENEQLVLTKSTTPDAPMALIFQPDGSSPWWQNLGDDIDAAAPRVLIPDHPALRFLDATAINFAGARELEAPEDALMLVESDQGVPLIYQVKRDGQAAIIVNMDPLAAEFYFSAWFPVLIHGAATYLSGREEELIASYPPASEVPVPGVGEEDTTMATPPDDATQAVVGKRYGPVNTLGFHQLDNASGKWSVGASLLNRQESLLGNKEIVETADEISTGWSLSLLLTLLAIAVVVAESLLYHRRKVG